jgi:secreted PhoX family phosphatase
LLATTGQRVDGTDYVWHGEPDGAATFVHPDGGWLYVSNSELNGGNGGVGVLQLDDDGQIVDAYRILGGTKWNCSGGATPWGTWLSCEEFRNGFVWECFPFDKGSQGIARPAMGKFIHEAAVVDPVTGYVYLTEDENDSRLYRFRPGAPEDLSEGVLEALVLDGTDVTWVETSTRRPNRDRTTASFDRGEGAWFSGGSVYFTTTGDDKVWRLDVTDPDANTLEVIYDAAAVGPDAPLREPDNITVHAPTGRIFVCEDDDDLQVVLLADTANADERVAAPFLQLVGHGGSELAGPAFSPDGLRFYVSSQRGLDGKNGMTFEITGSFLP